MTSIFLHDTDKNNSYGRSGRVTEEQYLPCQLFYRYKHESMRTLSPQNIYVYKKYNSGWSYYLTLTREGQYNKYGLQYEHVYFNKYEKKTPLILVLHFQGGGKQAKNRWYPYSKFSNLIDKGSYERIDKFNLYNDSGDSQLIQSLLDENDKLSEILTYDIGKTDTSKGGKYNNGKIKINEDKSNMSGEFTKYIHKPESGHVNKKACVLYNYNTIMGKGNKIPIPELQGQNYKSITVYYSNKIKEPLLLAFEKNTNTEYYYQKKDGVSLYWEKLNQENYKEVSGDSISKYEEIQTKLAEKGGKLLNVLEKIHSNAIKSIIILIDKQKEYKNTDVSSIKKSTDLRVINNKINPRDVTNNKGNCLSSKGFKVYEHDLKDSVSEVKQDEDVQLIFMMPNINGSNNYNEIKLFNLNGYTNILHYNKKNGNDKIYVYFYGNDIRPLMICYNNVYVPYGEDKYFTEWVVIDRIKQFLCDSGENEELITYLTQVVGFLNKVKLEQRPTISNSENEQPNTGGKNEHKYTLQKFNGKDINIKVTYENKKCYREYIHTPNGTNDSGDGYRLGNVTYSGSEDSGITYDLKKQLCKVSVYYNLYDNEHKHPLIVELEFKSGGSEYFKLIDKNYKMWYEIDDFNPNEPEKSLFKIRRELEITFTEEQKKTPLFNPEKCAENDNDNSKLIEASVGAAGAVGAAGGIGFGIFKNYSSVLSFFRSLF